MQYSDAINYMTQKIRLGIKPGLSRILRLFDEMGNPQDEIKIIHIAGTNGKGTVASMIANTLVKSGYKVGLFTSPYVIDYREQIQINNEFISENDFVKYVEKYGDNDLTEFEFLTAILYKYFYDNCVDYAVVECGMGGENDSTNVEKHNVASVLTSISLDHIDFLGDTVEKQAKEKSGIIRNSVCVIYPNKSCENVVEKVAGEKGARLIKVTESGDFNENNYNTVRALFDALEISEIEIQPSSLRGRQETIDGVLYDGSHNPSAVDALVEKLRENSEKITALIAMMKDKNVDYYVKKIAPFCNKIIVTSCGNLRAMKAEDLAQVAKKYCDNVEVCDNNQEALKKARQNENFALVCGSFYLLRELI